MATRLMSPETQPATEKPTSKNAKVESKTRRGRREPSVQEIIASARVKPVRLPCRGVWALGLATGLLFWAAFTPLDWGPVGWLAIVPVCLLIRIPERTRWMYTVLYATSLLQFLAVFQWMRLGDALMYPAWISLCVYLAAYLPVFVAVARTAVLRFRVPAVLAIPVVWVALEFLRAHLLSGISWYYLAHTQYRWLELIQISDLVGAYGVSFVIAMTAACLAGLVPATFLKRLRLLPADSTILLNTTRRRTVISVVATLCLFTAVLGYGYVRRSQANFQPGPRVALIQANFTTTMKHDPAEAQRIYRIHEYLTGQTVKYHPHLIVWPETMFRYPLVTIDPDLSDDQIAALSGGDAARVRDLASQVPKTLSTLSQKTNAALMIGVDTQHLTANGQRRLNSAAFVTPEFGMTGRYDKMHLVPFGEYVPFQELGQKIAPDLRNPGVTAGESAAVFTHKGWRFAPIICFEDTVPHLVRRIIKSTAAADKQNRPVDVLVNMTNDGWFHGSSELDQHLITAAFRAVECRTPMVRAVNTGVSAVIDGDGAIVNTPTAFFDDSGNQLKTLRDPQTGRWHKSLNAAIVHDVPLDDRRSLYVAWGDWFAQFCALFAVLVAIGGIVLSRREKRNRGRELFVKTVTAG